MATPLFWIVLFSFIGQGAYCESAGNREFFSLSDTAGGKANYLKWL